MGIEDLTTHNLVRKMSASSYPERKPSFQSTNHLNQHFTMFSLIFLLLNTTISNISTILNSLSIILNNLNQCTMVIFLKSTSLHTFNNLSFQKIQLIVDLRQFGYNIPSSNSNFSIQVSFSYQNLCLCLYA